MATYTVTKTNNKQSISGHSLGEFRNGSAFAVIKNDGSAVSLGGTAIMAVTAVQ